MIGRRGAAVASLASSCSSQRPDAHWAPSLLLDHGSTPDHGRVAPAEVRVEEELDGGLEGEPSGHLKAIGQLEDALAPRHVLSLLAERSDVIVRRAQIGS